MADWTFSDIPSQHGRSAIVTGTGGLGYETARALTQAGGDVILAGRSRKKGEDSVGRIRARSSAGQIRFETLDLANLASVGAFADRMRADRKRIDLLINNAGVMTPPTRQTTSDGFELQFGTNYLGHFALTLGLLPLLRQGYEPRVVNLSSLAHRAGVIDFDDLQGERRYRPQRAYSQSKLAMLMFTLELQRRSDIGGWGILSAAAHPGFARTDLIANGPGTGGFFGRFSNLLGLFLSHSAAEGALPTLFAATAPGAAPGGFYGPDGLFELKGAPKPATVSARAHDQEAAARLWMLSETLVAR